MGKPITWQNVNGPSLTDAAAPMAAAQRSFDTAFSRLGDELTRRETTQAKNYDQGKINNTEAFLAQISQYRTPEELQAAQQSGVFDALSQRFGAQVDQAAVRQAQDLRPGVLQERVQRENQFNDTQLDRAQAPTRDAIMAAINRGDILTANTLMSGAPEMRNMAGLEAASAQAQRGFVTAARGDADAAYQADLRPLEIKRINGAITAQALDAETRNLSAKDSAEERAARRKREDAADSAAKLVAAAKAKEAGFAAAAKDTVMANGTLNESGGKTKFNETLDALEKAGSLTPAARRDILYNLDKYAPNGMYNGRPVPADVALELLRESEENAFASVIPGWSRRGDNFANLLAARMDNPELQGQIDGVQARRRLLEAAAPNGVTPAPGTPAAPATPVVAPGAAPNPAALLRPDIVTTLIEPRRLQFLKSELELHRRSGNAAAFKKVEDQIAKEAQGAKK